MPGKVGRPRKNPEAKMDASDLVASPQYLEADLNDFWIAGQPFRLQRYFIADARRAEAIKDYMVNWLEEKLSSIIPVIEK